MHHINELLIKASQTDYAEIMAVTDEPLVSSDFNHSPYSLIVDLTQTLLAIKLKYSLGTIMNGAMQIVYWICVILSKFKIP